MSFSPMPYQWKRIQPFSGLQNGAWHTQNCCRCIEWRQKRSPRWPEIIWLFLALLLGTGVVPMFWLLNKDVAKHKTTDPMDWDIFMVYAGSIYGPLMGVLLLCWLFLPHVRIRNQKSSKVVRIIFKVLELGSVSFIGGFFRHPIHVYCWLLVVLSAFDTTLMKIVSPMYDFCGPSIILGIAVTVSFDEELRDLPFPLFILVASFFILGAVVLLESFERWDDEQLTAEIAAAAQALAAAQAQVLAAAQAQQIPVNIEMVDLVV